MIKRQNVKVIKIREETPDVKSFIMERPADFEYEAGQYVILFIGEYERAFSLASSPTENFLFITAKMIDSPFKGKMSGLLGREADISGPFGRFVLEKVKSHVMVAAGIGIAPFRSMIKCATDRGLDDNITLIYSNKTEQDIAFLDEFDQLQLKNKNLRVVHTLTRSENSKYRTGRVDDAMIREIADLNSVFYVCGPPTMVDGVVAMLKNMGIKEIRFEKFTGYK